MRDELIVEKIREVVSLLDEIDEMITSQAQTLQVIDYELSDYYHLIENNELNDTASINVVKKIHDLRKQRRSLNNESSIENTYQNHKTKLIGNDTRPFLLNEIYKTVKKLNSDYKNRILTDETIQYLLESPKKKVGRPKKEKNIMEDRKC